MVKDELKKRIRNEMVKKKSEGWYCDNCQEIVYPKDYIVTHPDCHVCPKCSNPDIHFWKNEPESKYQEKLKELLYDPEEEERIEIKAILDEIYKDKTIKDDYGRVTVLDLTIACLMKCDQCKELQPHTTKNIGKYVWFYCDECGWPSDFEILRND